jgi:hypothetical protein
MQTVTMVGYGDVVPEHLAGRLIGGALMLQGIALGRVPPCGIEQGMRGWRGGSY